MSSLRICYQWNIWEKLLSTSAASVTNDVYSHRSRGGTAGGSAQHLDSTPPSPWQPAALRSKTWFNINDALQMCLGFNWKQARQGCLVIKGDVFSGKWGGVEFCLFLTTSGETRTTSVSLGLQFHLQPFIISNHGHGFSHRSPLHQRFQRFVWNPFALVVFGSKVENCQNALGRKPGSAAYPCMCKCCPCAFRKRNLYHILLIRTEFPLLSERYPGLCYTQTTVHARVSVMVERVFIFEKRVSGMSLCLLVQGLNPLNSFQYSSWPCHCYRATIVEFTIEFGKVPSCDSHNLCLYLACTSFTFVRSVCNQRLVRSILAASFFTVRTTTVLERNTS